MDWERAVLEALRASKPAFDEPADWRAVLPLYDSLSEEEAGELDRTLLRMIDEDYKNPYSFADAEPWGDVLTALPAGLRPEDLLCIEAAVMVAAKRGLGAAYFAFNRLMRAPRWHAFHPRLTWLGHEAFAVQKRLALTDGGRCHGALLGLALGDALGATTEFMSREQVKAKYPDGHKDLTGGGPFGFGPGEWTDDTAMALCVARGIIESPENPVPAVGEHFMRWYASHPPDVGSTCRMALEGFSRSGSWAAVTDMVQRQLGSRAGGNGALMRTLPTALAYGPEPAPAIAIARMTHPHPESDAAVAFYHALVAHLVAGVDRQRALALALPQAGPLRAKVEGAQALTDEQVRATGYVVDTLEAALWAFLTTDSLESCLIKAANLGDDADTVAAVAGGLAGAAYGPAAAPRRWTAALKGRAELEEMAGALCGLRNHP